jgi:hypothetical protein
MNHREVTTLLISKGITMALTINDLQHLFVDDLSGTPLLNILSSAAEKQRIPYNGISYELATERDILLITPVFSYNITVEPNDSAAHMALRKRPNRDVEPLPDELAQLAVRATKYASEPFLQNIMSKHVSDFYHFDDNVFAELYSELDSSISDIKKVIEITKRKFVTTSNIDANYMLKVYRSIKKK